jgi:serine/threonine protein kinase
VALKVLRLDLAHQEGIAERFFREARAASMVVHPNAISIYDFGEDDGIFYLAMELLYGKTLRQRLKQEPPIQPEHALDIFESMGGALAAAHRVGVVHRDLKPDNIFLAEFPGHGEVVKVLDFGLAKLLDRGAGDEGLVTDVNLRLGTPRYMAPEQALGLQPIDARCDVYALGLLLFEMLSGRAPFVGEDGMEVLAQRLRRDAPRLSQVAPQRGYGEALDQLLSDMLVRDRERRPADANEVVGRLKELRRSGQVYQPGAGGRLSDELPEMRSDVPLHMHGHGNIHGHGAPPMSSPGLAGPARGRRASLPGPVTPPGVSPGLGVPESAISFTRAQALPEDSLAADDFDKPTVVITNRDDYPMPSRPSQVTPVSPVMSAAPPLPPTVPPMVSPMGQMSPMPPMASMPSMPQPMPQPMAQPMHPLSQGFPAEYQHVDGGPTLASPQGAYGAQERRAQVLGLPRWVIVALVVIALGAPLVALVIRFLQNQDAPPAVEEVSRSPGTGGAPAGPGAIEEQRPPLNVTPVPQPELKAPDVKAPEGRPEGKPGKEPGRHRPAKKANGKGKPGGALPGAPF